MHTFLPPTAHQRRPALTWEAGSSKLFPYLPVLSLLFAVLAAFAAVLILRKADGDTVEEWRNFPPTIIFSVLAIMARSLLGFASSAGGEIFWWNHLIRGTTLRNLHSTWSFTHSALFLFHPSRPWNSVRGASLAVLTVAAMGPLLQRSIVVELATKDFPPREVTLPVRIEPMWNLTTLNGGSNGHVFSMPMYRPDFAKIISDSNSKVAPMIPEGICAGDYTTNITFAGFTPTCQRNTTGNSSTVQFLRPARNILQAGSENLGTDDSGGIGSLKKCVNMTSESCTTYETWYQLAVGWKMAPVPTITYASYIREDPAKDVLTIQRCDFTTAFIKTTIRVTNKTLVAFLGDDHIDQHGLPQRTVIEPVGSAMDPSQSTAPSIIGGFVQALRDAFEGYALVDRNEYSDMIMGAGPRAAIDPASLQPPKESQFYDRREYGFKSPLPAFAALLEDLCLRYALVIMPRNDLARVNETEKYMLVYDIRAVSQAALKVITFAPEQKTVMYERRQVAVYRAQYIYAALAAAVAAFAAVMIVPLMWGWRRLGRAFTMSPLEVAKAFDAPILEAVGSNTTDEDIVMAVGQLNVRYGEAVSIDSTDMPGTDEDDRLLAQEGSEVGNASNSGLGKRSTLTVAAASKDVDNLHRLSVGRYSQVRPPRHGMAYQ